MAQQDLAHQEPSNSSPTHNELFSQTGPTSPINIDPISTGPTSSNPLPSSSHAPASQTTPITLLQPFMTRIGKWPCMMV